ncbi:MAG: PIN domain-containing protein [Planctomycetes bacterium]|nr:PIN domain-containing protein [Planctomycetota bacterium]
MLFVDTSAFYAVADESDVHHPAARELFEERAQAGELVTTDYVFVETWCLIRARLGRKAAMDYWDAMATGVVRVLGVSSADLSRARAIVRGWPDQDFSLVDGTSFAVIERVGIRDSFAFDVHFRVVRLGPARRAALRVVP